MPIKMEYSESIYIKMFVYGIMGEIRISRQSYMFTLNKREREEELVRAFK